MFEMFKGIALLLLAVACAGSHVAANTTVNSAASKSKHPLSIVEADIYVAKKKLIMRLKCFAEDLELLQGVEPYEDGKYDNTELEEGTTDHAKYLLKKVVILDANGEQMSGKIVEIKGFEIPEDGIRDAQESRGLRRCV